MENTTYIAIAIFSAVYIFSTLIYLIAKKYLALKEKEMTLDRVRLDEFRAHMDRQISEINSRFLSDSSRWKEVNHMLISAQSDVSQDNKEQPYDFLIRHGVDPNLLKQTNKEVFVLTPFHQDAFGAYQAIENSVKNLGLNVSRGDETKIRGDIFPHILDSIARARLIVANITGRNPNVLYELGIAHALDKNVILVSEHSDELPFDLRTKQILMYRSLQELEFMLRTMVPRALLAEDS